ncbi:MAG: nucleotidyltransferase domain-containing protein [Defluviitaleaceae bacterium]|nr:nucleotidyltransferase domain-containing protein [Defluviitaleaceae bacterium]
MHEVLEISKILSDNEQFLDDNIVKIYLFGSFARGEQTVYSDIDIALVYKNSHTVIRGAAHKFKTAVEDAMQESLREIGWFTTNEYNLGKSEDIFNTNTRIREEGILLWKRIVI